MPEVKDKLTNVNLRVLPEAKAVKESFERMSNDVFFNAGALALESCTDEVRELCMGRAQNRFRRVPS